MIRVVAGFLEKDGKVFLAKRASGDEATLGKWEFPGGKVELNETDEHALEREYMEEFDLKIKALDYLCRTVVEYPTKTVDLRLYRCEYVSGNLVLKDDHFDYKWVLKSDVLTYDLAQADLNLAKMILSEKK